MQDKIKKDLRKIKTRFTTKYHLMLNKYKLAKMQRCGWA